jgi:hypothetical protein
MPLSNKRQTNVKQQKKKTLTVMVFRVLGINRLTVAKGRPKVEDFLFEQFHGFGTVFNKSGFQQFGPHRQQLKQFRVV